MNQRNCQVKAVTEPSVFDIVSHYVSPDFIFSRAVKLAREKGFLIHKLKRFLMRKVKPTRNPDATRPAKPKSPVGVENPDFKAGDMVTVKALDDIEGTLDKNGKYEGLFFMRTAMAGFCGKTYPVKKKIVRFFDERRGRFLPVKNVVILDGVYCEKSQACGDPSAGCDRTCFVFWKTAWLETASK